MTLLKSFPIILSKIFGNNILKLNRHSATEATINLCAVDTYKMDPEILPKTSQLTRSDALSLYALMLEMRRMERRCEGLYRQKLIQGFLHLYMGMEAVAAGISSVLQNKDDVITSYRCHTWTMVAHEKRGETVLAELMGKTGGCARGKGGSMHLYAPKMFGGQAIVGAQVPMGTGMAFAHKYKNDGGVTIIALGDGATNNGQSYEAINMANLYTLPAFYLIEDNIYGMGTSSKRSSACTDYFKRAHPAPGISLDGQDVVSVRELARFALQYVRGGKGPIAFHTHTYRYAGHSVSDPGVSYRTRAEVDHYRKKRDPILLLKQVILDAKLATTDELKKIDSKVKKMMDEAFKVAKASPDALLSDLTTDVYILPLEKIRLTTILSTEPDTKPNLPKTKK